MIENSINILIVEDEIIASKYLVSILNSLGYSNIYEALDSTSAIEIVRKNKIDIVFMDINIKGQVDGIMCAHLLNKEYFLPIIYTTAYSDSQTILEASDTNVFSYLIKPFSSADVNASLSITLKKIKREMNYSLKDKRDEILDLGNFQTYNFTTKTLCIHDKNVKLTKTELSILNLFCENINQNVSYETLKSVVWEGKDISISTIRDGVSRLKKKAENLNIENLVNIGYTLKS